MICPQDQMTKISYPQRIDLGAQRIPYFVRNTTNLFGSCFPLHRFGYSAGTSEITRVEPRQIVMWWLPQ